MHRNIGRFTILVNDYDEAKSFYVNQMGFEVITDQPASPHRFVHLGYRAQFPVGIWLWEATEETRHLVGNQAGNHPLMVMYTEDCCADYDEMRAKGVEFLNEPTQTETEIYIHALDLYGNMIVLVEMLGTQLDFVQRTKSRS